MSRRTCTASPVSHRSRDATALLSSGSPKVVEWTRPPEELAQVAKWRLMWKAWGDEFEYDNHHFPVGASTYVNLRDLRGRTCKLAYLGSADDYAPLQTPAEVLLGPAWRLPKPAMCIGTDAGSMHPRQCDSINMMCNLPQYKEYVEVAAAEAAAKAEQVVTEPEGGAALPMSSRVKPVEPPPKKKERGRRSRVAPPRRPAELDPAAAAPAIIDVQQVMRKSIAEWQHELQPLEPDTVGEDESINNLIYSKLKAVFSAMLDAAKLAGSWVVVDRTDGQGSATAEVLIELALERGAQRPTIVAIDSLERLGRAREGGRSHKMIKQL